MKLDIVSKRENKALGRIELEFNVSEYAVTPSIKELREKLAALQGAKTGLVVIDKLLQGFGSETAAGTARVYSDADVLSKLEPEYLIRRNKGDKGRPKEKKEETAEGEAPPPPPGKGAPEEEKRAAEEKKREARATPEGKKGEAPKEEKATPEEKKEAPKEGKGEKEEKAATKGKKEEAKEAPKEEKKQ